MTTIVLLILAYAQIKDSFGTIGTPQIATQALPNAATAGTLSSGASDLLLTASFIFALFVLLGNRYMKERSARQRMSVLRLMVEKGQPISENLVREMKHARNNSGKVWHSSVSALRSARTESWVVELNTKMHSYLGSPPWGLASVYCLPINFPEIIPNLN
jgi:hypothetical protein